MAGDEFVAVNKLILIIIIVIYDFVNFFVDECFLGKVFSRGVQEIRERVS